MTQSVRFAASRDGTTLAWAASGRGVPLVKASNWLTDLEYDWESPVWRHWTEFFSTSFDYLRYDERGCGLSERRVTDVSFPRWVEDLEAVIEAAAPPKPFVLLGISQGASIAIEYAARHPEAVSRLILYGGFAVGAYRSEDTTYRRAYEGIQRLIPVGWTEDNPAFRQLFTSRFLPEGTPEQLQWFNDLCRHTVSADQADRLLAACAEVDVRERLREIRVPTLVVHATRDEVVPLKRGRELARTIPGAEFVQVASRNHVLLEDEAAWSQFREVVLRFTGQDHRAVSTAPFDTLTPRERDVLALLRRGHANVRIGAELGISEKTVRNHISRLYEKLHVRSRGEAIAMAHEHRFPG